DPPRPFAPLSAAPRSRLTSPSWRGPSSPSAAGCGGRGAGGGAGRRAGQGRRRYGTGGARGGQGAPPGDFRATVGDAAGQPGRTGELLLRRAADRAVRDARGEGGGGVPAAALEALSQGPRPEQVALRRAEVAAAEADVERARLRLDAARVVAPI